MKKAIWKNEELLEPYEKIGPDSIIVATDDGYVYWENTKNDPIDRFPKEHWEYWVDDAHQPEEL